jgi:DNA ligase (NAD+)
MLTFIAKREQLEIDGLGDELASLLVSKGYVTTLADLFEFQVEALAALETMGSEKFGKQIVETHFLPAAAIISMVRSIEKAKTARWDRWIAALGIPNIGIQMGKLLAERLELTSDSMLVLDMLFREIGDKAIDGLGPHKKAEIVRIASNPAFKDLCHRLFAAGVRPSPIAVRKIEGAPLSGMAFVVSGEFPTIGERSYLKEKLASLGAVPKSGVTKKTTHLLVGEEPGAKKLGEAAKLNIPLLDLAWLEKTFAQYGFKTVGQRFEVEGID